MDACKMIITFFAFLIVASASASVNKLPPRNIYECQANATKVKLLENIISRRGRIGIQLVDIFNYPEKGVNTNPITCLKVTNMYPTSVAGYVEIVSGGVGSYHVQIRLTSKYDFGLKFKIEIWGQEEITVEQL